MSLLSKPDKKKKEAEEPAVDGEGAEGEDGEGGAKKKGLPIMLIAIIAGAVLVLGGGGAAAYFLFLAPKHPPAAEAGKDGKDAKGEHGKDEKGKDKKKEEKGGHGEKKEGGDAKVDPATIPQRSDGPNGIIYYKMPAMIANIQAADGHMAYLQLQLTFEAPDADTADELDQNLPRINDLLQGFVRELRVEDLNGSQGNYQLRLEILRRVNLVMAPAKINAVLIGQQVVK